MFGESYGLEHPLWFAPDGTEPIEDVTFRRSNAFEHVARECATVRERRRADGNLRLRQVRGDAATGPRRSCRASWRTSMPAQGRIVLTPMLNERGKLIGDFTIGKLGPERFIVIGSGPAENYHMRWFTQHKHEAGVRVEAFCAEAAGTFGRRTSLTRSAAEARPTRIFRQRTCRSWPSGNWTSGRSR